MLTALRASASVAVLFARAKPGRLLYLVSTLAVAVLGWLLLLTLAAPFARQDSGPLAVVVLQNERQGAMIPMHVVPRIEALEGVASVEYMNVVPILCREPGAMLTLNGWGGDTVEQMLHGRGVPAGDIAAWRDDPLSVLVEARLAEQCGWRPGMALQPLNLTTSEPVELRIAGVYTSGTALGGQIAIAHYDYLDRLQPEAQRDQAIILQVRGTNPDRLPELAERIEAEFRASDPPLLATTSSDAEGALSRYGNVQALMFLVAAAMLTSTLLVFVSAFAHLAFERRPTMAVLQAIGFRRGQLFSGLGLELLLILAGGTAIGSLLAWALLAWLTPRVAPVLGYPATPEWVWLWLAPGLLALMAVTLALPLRVIARLRPTDHASF